MPRGFEKVPPSLPMTSRARTTFAAARFTISDPAITLIMPGNMQAMEFVSIAAA
jgi:hypothetical protein